MNSSSLLVNPPPSLSLSSSGIKKHDDVYLVLTAVFVGILYLLLTSLKPKCSAKFYKMLKTIPGPPKLPFFGNALLLNVENHGYYDVVGGLAKVYGDIYQVTLFYKPYILVSNADAVEKILSSNSNLDKGDEVNVFHSWWGSGLLTAPAQKWKAQRKLLNSTFSMRILQDFMEIFNKESKKLTERLDLDYLAKTGEGFNLIPYTTACTLNIICETAMGKKLEADTQVNQAYIDAVTGMYHILVSRMTKPWLRLDLFWKLSSYGRREKMYLQVLHSFTEKVIKEKREQRRKLAQVSIKTLSNLQPTVDEDDNGQKTRKAFMDYLLDLSDEGNGLSDIQIRNEVDTFMAAGHDTTAYTVSWTLFLLATYPEHQIKVQQELDEIFKEDKHRPVSSTDLSKMSYLGLCIKETLRLYPIVPFNIRKTGEDIFCENGKIIPSGINVVIMPYILHKDPKHFHQPDEFRPERFLAENCLKRHPFAYIPFSAGPRNCIGQKFGINEAKTILSYLLRKFDWKTLDKRSEIKLDLDLVLRAMGGLNFSISKRS